MKISIKKFFVAIGVFIFFLMVLFFYFLRQLELTSANVKAIEYNRYLLIKTADELRQSSEDLTKFARLYISTGNIHYKQYYFSILAIRQGKSPRPENYDNTYWNLDSAHKEKFHPMGLAMSLDDATKKLPYTSVELDYLKKAERNSNNLVTIESKAFKLIDEMFSGVNRTTNSFIEKLMPFNEFDSKKSLFWQANLLLNSPSYFTEKQSIMLPIDMLLRSVEQRTHQELVVTLQHVERLSFVLNGLVVATFLLFLFMVLRIKLRVFEPINYISKTINAIKNSEQIPPYHTDFKDEFDQMVMQFSHMYKENIDTLTRLKLAFKISKQSWFELNLTTLDIVISDEFSKMLGYDSINFETSFSSWQSGIHPDDLPTLMYQFNKCIAEDSIVECEYRRKKTDGSWLWLHSIGQVVEVDENNKPVTMVGLHMDISQRKEAEFRENMRMHVIELLFSNTELTSVLEFIVKRVNEKTARSNCGIFLFEKENKSLKSLVFFGPSSAYSKMLDIKIISGNEGSCGISSTIGTRKIISDIDINKACLHCKEAAKQAGFISCWSEPIIGAKKEVLGVFSIRFKYVIEETQELVSLLKFVSQLTALVIEQIKMDQQLILSAKVFSDTHEGIIITDADINIIDVNKTFTDITGYSKKEVLGKKVQFLQSDRHTGDFYKKIWQTVNNAGFWQGDMWNRKKDDSLFSGLFNISKVENSQGITNYIGLFSDITLLKTQQQSLELLAHYDPLTKLPNRTLFEDRFKQAVARQKRSKKYLAIGFLDLDNFKPVNDDYGHDIGDELLKQVARRITNSLRAEDTVFRQGGDEFVLLLNGVDSIEHCHQLMTRLHQILAQPFECGQHHCEISASSGVTFYTSANENLDNLLRNADQAMYQAKKSGKNTFHFFNDFDA